MDKRIRTFDDHHTESKRKFEDTSRNTQNQPQHNKRQNTGRAYTAGSGNKKQYGGSKPLCPKSSASVNLGSNQRGNGTGQGPTFFECGVRGHFKKDCPKLKNNNNNERGNQVRNAKAPAKVYAIGHAGTNPDSNVVTAKNNMAWSNRHRPPLIGPFPQGQHTWVDESNTPSMGFYTKMLAKEAQVSHQRNAKLAILVIV
ncbi:putative reverse transcriptase domain-containing protein [Tanacetum coccineum]